MKLHAQPSKDKRAGLHRLWMGTVVTMMTVAALGQTLLHAPEEEAAEAAPLPARNGRVVAYVQDRAGLTLTDDYAASIDQLNYSFALLKNGKASGEHWHSISEVRRFLKRNPQVQGVLAVGGWGAEGFSDAVSTEAGLQRLADSILALVDEHGFTGVDLDWEYPGSGIGGLKYREDDWENYMRLMELLRAGLDVRTRETGVKHTLSAALGASESLIKAVDGQRLSALLDHVNLMTYDLRGFDRITGHHAGLYPDGEEKLGGAWVVNAYAARGIPRSKMQLGAALYGRAWRKTPIMNDGLHQRAATAGNKILKQADINAAIASGSYVRHFDEKAQSPWLFDGSTFVSYEDEASLKAKALYVQEHGLSGISCWALDHDDRGELLRALSDELTN